MSNNHRIFRTQIALTCLLAIGATAALAQKPIPSPLEPRACATLERYPVAPDVRQGGDTILDAVPIVPCGTYTGTTLGYCHDYDEACPYEGSTSPDVVYSFVFDGDTWVVLDLYGSDYDTKVYVYDDSLNLLGCNDDHYSDYTSLLEFCAPAGMTCYIVIDGYGGDSGNYVLDIPTFASRCELEIPIDAVDEGEPWPPAGEWIDCFNGGCQFEDSCDPAPWQILTGDPEGRLIFHGCSGFDFDGAYIRRDWDWFEAEIGPAGVLTVEADAEIATMLYVMAPLDCESTISVQTLNVGPCTPGTLFISGIPGSRTWLRVIPLPFSPPTCDPLPFTYDYLLQITGLKSGPVVVRQRDWSSAKELFR